MKDQDTVIKEFNDLVNMTVSELEAWLDSEDSQAAGWPKGEDGKESVGHDSGRKIISILESNPDKNVEKYTDDQVDHMRKVVSYCKRHLAQEEKSNSEKSTEEVKKTKSYASLKNWGHDILKTTKADENGTKAASEQQTGDKRKAADENSGSNKKRETKNGKSLEDDSENDTNGHNGKAKGAKKGRDTRSKSKGGAQTSHKGGAKDDGTEDENEEDDGAKAESEEEEHEEEENDKKGNDNREDKKSVQGPKPGDTVSWNWGNGQPEGKVLDVKDEKTTVETKNGNQVSRKGDAEDPAVVIDTGKSKAIKSAHELN